MEFPDFDIYAELGVQHDAKEAEIKQAYRKLARRYHLDVSKEAGSLERFKRISRSYEILSDEDTRREYDEYVVWLRHQQLMARSGARITVSTGGSPTSFYFGSDASWGDNWRTMAKLFFGPGWQDEYHPIAERVGRTLDWVEVRPVARNAIKVFVGIVLLALLWGFIVSL